MQHHKNDEKKHTHTHTHTHTNCHQTIFAYKIQFITTYHQLVANLDSGVTTTNKLHQQK